MMLAKIAGDFWIDLSAIIVINYGEGIIELIIGQNVLNTLKIPDETGAVYQSLIKALHVFYTGEVPPSISKEIEVDAAI